MKLNKNQEKIVKAIANGTITDIYSFIQVMEYGNFFVYSKSYVEEKFAKTYENKKYKCETRSMVEHKKQKNILEEIDSKTCYCKPDLNFYGASQMLSHGEIIHSFPFFSPVYITKKVDKIISFIALWQYLKEQALIIELPKSCTKDDMGLFVRPTPDNDTCKSNIDEDHSRPYTYLDLNVSFHNFFGGKFTLDERNFEICLPYLTKTIFPVPELQTFIQKKFKTKEEINNRRNFWIALAGATIAFFTAIASIIVSVVDKGYHKELNQINESLQKIEASIPENQSATDISDKLDGITETIKGLQENTENEKGTVNQSLLAYLDQYLNAYVFFKYVAAVDGFDRSELLNAVVFSPTVELTYQPSEFSK